MKDYLIDTGAFNIIVRPQLKVFYVLGADPPSQHALMQFLQGAEVDYAGLESSWFSYDPRERWTTFDAQELTLGEELSEAALIDQFVLKQFNFGGLVALRDVATAKVKVFKRDRLRT